MRTTFILALLAVGSAHASAEQDAVTKYRGYTPQQIAALPEAELRSEVPMMYSMAASTANSPGSELLFSMQLNRLMYNGVGDFDGAVRAFQQDLGDPPTGELTVGQIDDLGYRSELQSLEPVGFPSFHYSRQSTNYAIVKGTVTILDERIAYPINYVQISCNRGEGYCEYDQMVMMLPSEESWSQTYHVQKFNTELYRIIRWEGGQIDAVPETTPTGCRINTLSLNFETKEFYEIVRNQSGDCDFGVATLPKLDRPRLSQIVDGAEIFQSEFARLKGKAFEALSSDFRNRIDAERQGSVQ